jgi:hypothetical protein
MSRHASAADLAIAEQKEDGGDAIQRRVDGREVGDGH